MAANKWIRHVQQVAKEKGISYREALSVAKKTYKPLPAFWGAEAKAAFEQKYKRRKKRMMKGGQLGDISTWNPNVFRATFVATGAWMDENYPQPSTPQQWAVYLGWMRQLIDALPPNNDFNQYLAVQVGMDGERVMDVFNNTLGFLINIVRPNAPEANPQDLQTEENLAAELED